MRSSTAVGFEAAFGRFTSMPRYIMGAVSMKMSSRTSTTSTRGMMLISAIDVPIRREPSPASALKAIFTGAGHLVGGAREEVEQVQRESLHLGGPVLHAVHEVVVADDGGNRRAQAERGRDQGLRDTRRHDGQRCGALLADAVEGG